jgi:hypothetical protein
VAALLDLFQERLESPVEIELALTLEDGNGRLAFLQVRPMAVGRERVELADTHLADAAVVVASARALGNGRTGPIRDVLFVKRSSFDMKNSRAIARQIAEMNAPLAAAGRPCVLVGFGRWGSADPWLGIPVAWDQVSAARVIVEASLPGLAVEMSQGAHFFHNLMGLNVPYLSVPDDGRSRIDWDWLEALPRVAESDFVCHAGVPGRLDVEVDGLSGRGRIVRSAEGTHA